MDRGTLSAEHVSKIVTDSGLVPLRVYVDKHPDTCRDYRVPNPELRDETGFAPYPSIQLWTPSGVIVSRVDGLLDPEPFGVWLTKALADWPAVAKEEEDLRAKVATRGNFLIDLARFYARQKTFRKAAEAWVKLSRHPQLPPASKDQLVLQAGHTYLMHANYEKANEYLSQAAREGAKTREQALHLLGFSCQQSGKKEEALKHYEDLLREFPASKHAPAAKKALGKKKVFR